MEKRAVKVKATYEILWIHVIGAIYFIVVVEYVMSNPSIESSDFKFLITETFLTEIQTVIAENIIDQLLHKKC